jgi:hypothetical protein
VRPRFRGGDALVRITRLAYEVLQTRVGGFFCGLVHWCVVRVSATLDGVLGHAARRFQPGMSGRSPASNPRRGRHIACHDVGPSLPGRESHRRASMLSTVIGGAAESPQARASCSSRGIISTSSIRKKKRQFVDCTRQHSRHAALQRLKDLKSKAVRPWPRWEQRRSVRFSPRSMAINARGVQRYPRPRRGQHASAAT